MNNCPFCGAIISDSAVSHCPSCGREITKPILITSKLNSLDVNYDGYYDDIKPDDADRLKHDKTVAIKVGFLIGGILLFSALCVCIISLL